MIFIVGKFLDRNVGDNMPRTQKVMENVQDNIDLQTANELYTPGVEGKTLLLEHRKTIDDTLKKDISNNLLTGNSRDRDNDEEMIKKIRHNDTRSKQLKEGISGNEKMFVERIEFSINDDVVKTGIWIYPDDKLLFTDIHGNASVPAETRLLDIKSNPSMTGAVSAELLLIPKESGSALLTIIRAR